MQSTASLHQMCLRAIVILYMNNICSVVLVLIIKNGLAERNIKTVAQWARANMLHFAHHWHAQANVHF
jgi:hypothetical protein